MSTAGPLQHADRGFTLVELLVVLMVVGIAVASVSLSIGGDDSASRAEERTEQFMLEARFVSEQTVLAQEVIGLFWEPRSAQGRSEEQWCYRWLRLRDGDWQPMGEEALSGECLPSEMQVDIRTEGEQWQYDAQREEQRPTLVFYPSGEATPYEMAIIPDRFSDAETQRVEISMMGERVWRNRDERESR